MKISIFSVDPGSHRFINPIMEAWQRAGHQVELLTNYGPREADIYFFDFCDNNLIVASRDCKEDLKGKKVIARLHAVEYYLGFHNSIDWSCVNDLIFVSDHMRRKCGNLPVRTHVVPNGIDLDRLEYKERKPGFNIGYAGSIVPAKGILLMFHYFKELLNKDDRYRLYIIGLSRFHGREGEYYQHYLDVAGLRGKVFEGEEVSDINAWMENMNYLWQPSLAESFSIIVGEAMAKGIKPIVNNFNGSEEIWMPETIYKDFDEFYKIITGEYNSRKYRDFVEKYSLDKQIEKFNEIVFAQK